MEGRITDRATSGGAERMLHEKFDILDHGFIRLVDYMGDDSSIVQAARVSYGKGTKTQREDAGLIRYLMRNEHTSPFEMCRLKFHIKMPIFVARQWVRHRTASLNEYSGRYSVLSNDFYVPRLEDVQPQSKNNKQGRESADDMIVWSGVAEDFVDWIAESSRYCYEGYDSYIDLDVARELARIGIPVNVYTEMYWSNDLLNTFKFLKLRMDSHAQMEIRAYANTMAYIVQQCYPIAYAAFQDYVLDSLRLSGPELRALQLILGMYERDLGGILDACDDAGMSKGEINEFLLKLPQLGIFVDSPPSLEGV